jgi:outer membrane murein-binding lipoprotein Lpp
MKFSLLSRHPRLAHLLVTRAVAFSFALSGCVPATKYEQVSSAAEVEREGHRRAVLQLNAQEEELKRV